jgi:hypothetical protein
MIRDVTGTHQVEADSLNVPSMEALFDRPPPQRVSPEGFGYYFILICKNENSHTRKKNKKLHLNMGFIIRVNYFFSTQRLLAVSMVGEFGHLQCIRAVSSFSFSAGHEGSYPHIFIDFLWSCVFIFWWRRGVMETGL